VLYLSLKKLKQEPNFLDSIYDDFDFYPFSLPFIQSLFAFWPLHKNNFRNSGFVCVFFSLTDLKKAFMIGLKTS